MLAARGVTGAAAQRQFLAPRIDDLTAPDALPDMARAVAVLREAKARGEVVAIAGDYDCDGVTATAVLARILSRLGVPVSAFAPHRLHDGYGPSARALRSWAGAGIRTLVTVDTGTRAADALALARALGFRRIVVTDHHEVGPETEQVLALSDAVVNPVRAPGWVPFDGRSGNGDAHAHHAAARTGMATGRWAWLCGVGVAFALGRALAAAEGADAERVVWPELPLVALGTIADQVPLVGDNRILVATGLARLRCDAPVGLRALAQVAGIALDRLDERDAAFTVVPRLNAPGRVADPGTVVALLTTDDATEAHALAMRVEEENGRRRRLSEQARTVALRMLRAGVLGGETPHGIVAWSVEDAEGVGGGGVPASATQTGWHPGVVGLVAARLAEVSGRPACALAYNATRGAWVGSVRAPDPERAAPDASLSVRFSVVDLLTACREHFTAFGGHVGAGGLTLRDGSPHGRAAFRAAFDAACAAQRLDPARQGLGGQRAEAAVSLADLDTPEMRRALEALKPYGPGHRPVRFGVGPVAVTHARHLRGRLRTRQHFAARARQEGTHVDLVGWELGAALAPVVKAWEAGAATMAALVGHVDLAETGAASAGDDGWRPRLRLVVEDLAPHT